MFNVSRRTFKALVDEVLDWTGDAGDEGNMRSLVEHAIRTSHEKRLTENRYSFMLFPTPQSFTTVAGQRNYSLHEAFLSPLFFYNRTAGWEVIDVPHQRMGEHQPLLGDERKSIKHIALQGVAKVKNQPLAAATLTPTSSDPSDDGKQVIVVGETANGLEEETLTLPNAGSTQFITVLDVTKVETTWVGTLTLTANDSASTTVLTLGASQYGRQFRQLYTLDDQTGGEVVDYQFFRHPKPLRYDYDIPDTPYPFDRIHVLDALLDLAGFTRASAAEVKRWERQVREIEANLEANYQDGQANNSEAVYAKLVPR